MKIDGKIIAQEIYNDIKERVGDLRTKNIVPTLSVILVGNDPGSENYVRQKQIHSEKVGIQLLLKRLDATTIDELKPIVDTLNADPTIHGIIIQRPLDTVSDQDLDTLVIPSKDVDGFHPKSKYDPPIARAVVKLLQSIHPESFDHWLAHQRITVLGKGRTAGGPTIKHFKEKYNIQPQIVDSKTEDPTDILKNSTIIISAVGKKDAVVSEMIQNNPVLIGVGLHKEAEGKLHGDFDENTIEDKTSYYSGTPGGVGPVNVAMLLQNVLVAAENS